MQMPNPKLIGTPLAVAEFAATAPLKALRVSGRQSENEVSFT